MGLCLVPIVIVISRRKCRLITLVPIPSHRIVCFDDWEMIQLLIAFAAEAQWNPTNLDRLFHSLCPTHSSQCC
jgi:hypothetical protein